MRINEFSKESWGAENGILKSYSIGEKSRGSMTWEGKMNSRKVGCRWREGVFPCRGKSSWQCQRSVQRGWPCRAWVPNSIKAAWLIYLQCAVDVKVGSEPGEGTFQGENLEALYWQLQCLRQRLWPYPASSIILLVWVQLLFQRGLPLSGAFLILLPDALLASQPRFLTSLISLLLSLNSGDLQLWKIDILVHNWEKGVSVIALCLTSNTGRLNQLNILGALLRVKNTPSFPKFKLFAFLSIPYYFTSFYDLNCFKICKLLILISLTLLYPFHLDSLQQFRVCGSLLTPFNVPSTTLPLSPSCFHRLNSV